MAPLIFAAANLLGQRQNAMNQPVQLQGSSIQPQTQNQGALSLLGKVGNIVNTFNNQNPQQLSEEELRKQRGF